jgi:hypothetical protein
MNHFLGLLILSVCVATAFTLLNQEDSRERTRYFLKLMCYMVVGSLVGAWAMSLIPW